MKNIKDQVIVKEQERKAIHASNSAMKSAMNIISGNQKRYMFDMALEAIADNVSAGEWSDLWKCLRILCNLLTSNVVLRRRRFESANGKMKAFPSSWVKKKIH